MQTDVPTDAPTIEDPKPVIQLVEPQGHRRAQAVFLNGRMIHFDLELEDLVERVRVFGARGSWLARAWQRLAGGAEATLTLPVIDEVDGIVIQAPLVFTKDAITRLQTMGRCWIKATPAQGRTGAVDVVRGDGGAFLKSLQQEHAQKNGRRHG